MGATTPSEKGTPSSLPPLEDQLGSEHQSTELLSVDASPRRLHGWKWAVSYGSLLSVTFLFALDNTIVAAIQPSILASLGRVNLFSWIGVSFSLGSTAILAWSKAYGVFDIKWLFLVHIVMFEVGSAICGAAPTMPALIIGRVVAGFGGCGMYSGSLTYIAALTSIHERPLYTAGIAVIWGLGSVLGPVVGAGFASSSATWRWGFYINIVVGAVFSPAYIFLLPQVCLQADKTIYQKLRMVDWIGVTVFAGGAVSFIMAVTSNGETYPWGSGSAITLWVVSGVCLVATISLSYWHPLVSGEDRLIPVHFFRRPVLLNLAVQMFLVSGVMLGFVYYIPVFFAFTRGDDAMQAGVRLLPFVCLMVFSAILSGALMPKTGHYMPWYVAGSLLVTLGSGLMLSVNADTGPARVYGYTVLVGAGVGCYVVAGFAVTQAMVKAEDVSNAVAFQSIAQVLGCVVLLAVAGSIYENTSLDAITPLLPVGTPSTFASELIAGTSSSAFASLSPEVAGEVISALTKTLRNVWIFFLSSGALSLCLSLFLDRKRLNITAG
ncbi:hypothetical protein CNMCM8980_000420 [Aspergillus fumigatiaffinis]|uniref:Major facilitator superfamily (MFS) profile domain-containing protein n=1 Tax=Aspergillus fumigatiaffinis TaxID=340414 RepID=A0A8H4GH00_9EURO|nr:hypothetical protein CNMCM6457_003049 [Aspergillus fumigatiaffinis]KAF4220837.1 hypothetical protein CNMCM5878_000493 [Aspergillus fumigatiaffinis]KAF4242092.1 hypothetical protein CNMCM6805_003207 [Aspergillus fumigatiaffinis]KAF4250590.1 hypothetical protein CNMCM8980_000420 [Aspergillus fumigatiaffinis]